MMIDNRDFFVGTNTYDKTTLPTGEIRLLLVTAQRDTSLDTQLQ